MDGLSKNSEEKYCDVFTRLGANLATFLSLKVPWSTRLQRSPEVGKYFFVRFYSYCKNASKQIHLSAKIQERFFLRCKNAKKKRFLKFWVSIFPQIPRHCTFAMSQDFRHSCNFGKGCGASPSYLDICRRTYSKVQVIN